jgi:monoterpene epsilon-lactone hydrolase
MPSDAFRRHTDRLRAAGAPGRDGAIGQLLDQMRAGDARPAHGAAAPDGVGSEAVEVAGRPAEWLVPDGADDGAAILHLHGGAYSVGSLAAHQALAAHLAQAAGRRVLFVDYRLAPEHPFPAALDDAASAYAWLQAEGPFPHGVALAGESAGGGLAAALLLALRERGVALPVAGALMSPWLDLADRAGWRRDGADSGEPLLRREQLALAARLYADGHALEDALVSPARGELAGLPPLLVQSGSAEALFPDAERFAARARAAGVDVTWDPWDGMWHVWQSAVDAFPEAGDAVARAGAFLRDHTGG